MAADLARPAIERLDLLGVPLDLVEPDEIECLLAAHLADDASGFVHLATLNPEYVVSAQTSKPFRHALRHAHLVVPDGVGIVLAVRALFGRSVIRTTGVDLVDWLLTAELPGMPRIFLLGTPGSIAELQGRYPTRVVGRWGGGTADAVDDAESIDRIRERAANVVLVGYGAPAQILWIERNREALADAGVQLAVGVGGAFDYLSGMVSRAPGLVQRSGFEWAYRLLREPWRWRRQLALPRFALLVVRARFQRDRAI